MSRPGEADLRLVGEAVSALRRGPQPHVAAAAVRSRLGDVVTALTLDGTCAESAALSVVLSRGDRLGTLVAVAHVDADRTVVTPPCAACVALLRAHSPDVRVLHLADGLRVGGLSALA